MLPIKRITFRGGPRYVPGGLGGGKSCHFVFFSVMVVFVLVFFFLFGFAYPCY